MNKIIFRFILLIFLFLSINFSIKSQDFIAKLDTTGVLCETTFSDIVLNINQIAPDPIKTIYGFRWVILYDHEYIRFDSISYAHGAFSDSLQVDYVEDTIFLQVDSIVNPNPFGSGTLFKLRFTGVERGLTQIRFLESECYILTTDSEPITPDCENLQIDVQPGHLEAFLEQTNWGCSYENKGQAYITVLEGTPPYQYEWQTSPIQTDTFAQGLYGGERHIYITDGNRCKYDTSIAIEVLPAPNFSWTTEPDSNHIVIEKLIKFFVTEQDGGMNWYWEIVKNGGQDTIKCSDNHLDILNCDVTTEYIFYESGEYIVMLSAQSADGCDTTIQAIINVLPIELEFKNVITPDKNRFKVIVADQEVPLSDVFVSHEFLVYNRVGKLVYKTENFPQEGWDGGNLGDGTYYYVLKAETLKDNYYYRGNLVILGKN